MTREDLQVFKEKLNDKSFVEKLITIEKPEEVQVYLKDAGFDVSIDEVKVLGKVLEALTSGEADEDRLKKEISIFEKQENGEELTEDELEMVSGGSATLVICCGMLAAMGAFILTETGCAIYDAIEGTDYANKVGQTVIGGIIDGISKLGDITFEDIFSGW
jgi:class IIb bacteriocin, lactobin A/cerein 7B family